MTDERREKARLYRAAYYQANKVRSRANSKAWDEAYPDKARALRTEWRKKNPHRSSAFSREWYHKNKERARATHREWAKANPGYDDAKKAERRSKRLTAPGRGISAKEWNDILSGSAGLCAYCNERRKLTIDHVDPLSRGGAHDVDNAVAACASCNSSKHNSLLIVFLAQQARARKRRT